MTQGQLTLSADTVVQVVIDGIISHRGERRAVGEGVNSLLVPPGDERALTTAINTMLNDTASRSRMGTQAQRYFQEKLDYPTFYNKMTDLYRSLLEPEPVINIVIPEQGETEE